MIHHSCFESRGLLISNLKLIRQFLKKKEKKQKTSKNKQKHTLKGIA